MKYPYDSAKIYEIRCNLSGKLYIGSTTNPLSKRLNNHKTACKSYSKGIHNYVTSFDIIKDNNYNIYLLEDFPCDSLTDLRKREGLWIQKLRDFGFDVVNKLIAGRTEVDRSAYVKAYYQVNKLIISTKKKQKVNCGCGASINKSNIARHNYTKKHLDWIGANVIID